MRDFLSSRLAPFQSSSFRKFMIVQLVSLSGIWAFDLARAWIVVDGLGRASELGLVLMASALPGLVLSLYGGAIVDRIDVRKIMIYTKFFFGLLSIILAVVVEFYEIQLWHLIVFGLMQGCVSAIDNPTFHALTVRLVPQKDFQQALAINSTNFHFSRALGPIIAGVLMAAHGPSLVFLFDGITYWLLLFVLSRLKLREVQRDSENAKTSPWAAIKEGLVYLFSHPQLRYLLLQLFATLVLILPLLIVVLRTYIKTKFQLNEVEFSYVFTFPAVGSMIGALGFTFFMPKTPYKVLLFAVPLGVLSIMTIQFTPTAEMAAYLMTITGITIYLCLASLTVSLNLLVKEAFRGRLGAVMTIGFMSITPLVGYPIGALADHFGYEPVLAYSSALFALASFLLYLAHRRQIAAFSSIYEPASAEF